MNRKELQQILKEEGLLEKYPFFSVFGEKKNSGSCNYIKKSWFHWYYIAQGDRGRRDILFKSRSEDEVCAFAYKDLKEWDKEWNKKREYEGIERLFGRDDILYANYQPHLPSYSLAQLELEKVSDINFDFSHINRLSCEHLYDIKKLLCQFLNLRYEELVSVKAVRYNLLQGLDSLLFEILSQDKWKSRVLCNIFDDGIVSMILVHTHFFKYGEITVIEKTESELLSAEQEQCVFKYTHSLTNRIDVSKNNAIKKEGYYCVDKSGIVKLGRNNE